MAAPIPPNTHHDSDELRSARAVRMAYLAAERARPAAKPLRVLSKEELLAPLDPSEIEQEEDYQGSLPEIIGYDISKEISRGGQATVYLATQETTGRLVAVKVLAGGATAIARYRVRFEREVRALASLQHPNIVGILDRGRTQDRSYFLVMDYVDGCEFDDYVKHHMDPGPEGTTRLLQLFIKIALAIEEAHKLGIVHRDIKPSNIRIDSRGEPRILDFGLARRTGIDNDQSRSLTVPGHIVGSLPWSSPEQAAGEEDVTNQSDVYSIGVMLYEAIAGQRPYSVHETLREALDNIAYARPIAPSQVKTVRPAARQRQLDAIILKCLAKAPGDRYASAGMLAADLENLLSGRDVAAAPHKTSRKAIAGLVVLTLAGIAGTAWHDWPASTPRTFQVPAMQNSIGQQMVRLPAGKFVRNSRLSQDKDNSASPVVVQMPSFSISTTEVTQEQYAVVMGVNPSLPPDRGPTLPVQNVSWDDAVAFCQRLSAKEHRHYRLPSGAEWEYACEGGIYTPTGAGNINDMGWCAGNSNGTLHPVGQKKPNPWGIYDMHGGVAEWCGDELADTAQSVGPGRESSPWRIIRGGSFLMSTDECHSTSQDTLRPAVHRRDIGFRIVLNEAGQESPSQ